MDALKPRVALIAVSLLVSTGATYRTRNFVVMAPDADEAQAVAEAAETYRRRLAVFWTGRPLNTWRRPCRINVRSGACGAAGQTTFQFTGSGVTNWKMMVQGTSERILDSVLPHEVNHTVFASYFRRPLPRWADEGASTLFEHSSEQQIQLDLLQNVVKKSREYIPLRRLLSMKHYPTGHRAMLILYAEGFGLVDFLMQQGGRKTYLKFLTDARSGRWEAAIRKHYNHKGVEALERDWRSWVIAGMPRYGETPEELIATLVTDAHDGGDLGGNRPEPQTETVRGQSPDPNSSRQRGTTVSQPRRSDDLDERPRLDVSPRLTAFQHDRRFTVQAPTPHSTPPRTRNSKDPDSRRKRHTATDDRREHAERIPFSAESRLQPTHHQRQNTGANLPWKRNVETGSIPQWAGFPGQSELF